jgi:hypothetical protein
MNCAPTPLLVAIPLSYLIAFSTLAIGAIAFSVNRRLLTRGSNADKSAEW